MMNKLQFTDDAELNMGVNVDGNAVDSEARARGWRVPGTRITMQRTMKSMRKCRILQTGENQSTESDEF